MPVVRGITVWEDHPTEEGVRYQFRLLGYLELKEAGRSAIREAFSQLKEMGQEGLELVQKRDELRSRLRSEEGAPEPEEDSLTGMSVDVLLEHGLVSWTYGEPCDSENKGGLDGDSAIWAARRIVELSRAPSKAELKNSSAPSTSS